MYCKRQYTCNKTVKTLSVIFQQTGKCKKIYRMSHYESPKQICIHCSEIYPIKNDNTMYLNKEVNHKLTIVKIWIQPSWIKQKKLLLPQNLIISLSILVNWFNK